MVCTNEPLLVSKVQTCPPINNSDHDCVSFEILCSSSNTSNSHCNSFVKYLWDQGDYRAMSEYLSSIRWTDLLCTNFTADSIWCTFSDILNVAIEMYIPHKICSSRQVRGPKKRQYPKLIRKIRHKKLIKWRKLKTNRGNVNFRILLNIIKLQQSITKQ